MSIENLSDLLTNGSLQAEVWAANYRAPLKKERITPADWFAKMAVGGTMPAPRATAEWYANYDQLVQMFKGSVYIAAGAIARKIASMGISVYRRSWTKTGLKREPVRDSHPLVELLNNPNAHEVPYEMHYLAITWQLLCGDSYFWKIKNGFGTPVILDQFSPQWVKPIQSGTRYIDGYQVFSRYLGAEPWHIPREEMIHVREPNVDKTAQKRFFGFPVVLAAENTAELEKEMFKRLRYTFNNYARPGLIFGTKKRLNDKQLEQQWTAIHSQHRLAEQSGNPMMVHDEMELLAGADRTTAELDYLGSLEATLKFTCAVFGVPLAVVGLVADQNRANAEAAMYTFATNTINPRLVHYSQILTKDLGKDFDDDLEVQVGPFEVDNLKDVLSSVQVAWHAGAVTPNEVRDRLLGLPPLQQGGDTPVLPAGNELANYGNESGAGLMAMTGDETAGSKRGLFQGVFR